MANKIKELFPDIPTAEIDQYKITVWTYDIHVTRAHIRKITWEYHVNTPWKVVYPDRHNGADFTHQWCIRHNDRKCYEGRMREGWDEIFNARGQYFFTEHEAKQAAIIRLKDGIKHYQDLVEECKASIASLSQ